MILGLSALFVFSACKKDEFTEDPGTGSGGGGTPVLVLSETALTVSAEGGVVSVDYQVENSIEGSSVSVDLGEVSWITNANVTDSTIEFTVDANADTGSRTATLTVSYPGAEDVSLTVVQTGQDNYDYDITTVTATATYYRQDDYHTYIWADINFTDMSYSDGNITPPGTILTLRTYMPYDKNGKIATGTYTASTTTRIFYINSGSSYMNNYTSEDVSDYTQVSISSGSMIVTEGTGENYYSVVCDF